MKPPARALSPRSRDLAVERIRSLTMATAVAGIVGTGAFGALAAINYSGTTTASGSDNGAGTDPANDILNESTTQDDESTNDDTTRNTTTSGFNVAPPAVSSSRRSHVSSGGS